MSAPTIPGILHKPGAPVFFNPAMMVPNTFEIDVAGDVLADLQRHADALRAMEDSGAIYALDGGLRLYNERPRKWRSDICWLSHADEASYYWFEDIYRRLGLGAMVARSCRMTARSGFMPGSSSPAATAKRWTCIATG
ncbi:MAG: hypothetical protein V4521_03250 [Pseudomonadota bacterium]